MSLFFGETEVQKIIYNNTELTELILNGVPVWNSLFTFELDGDRYIVYARDPKNLPKTEIIIPSTFNGKPVYKIGAEAFYRASTSDGSPSYPIDKVVIPASITNIAINAFKQAFTKAIEVAEDNQAYQSISGNLYSKDGTILYAYAAGKSDWAGSFTIPSTVTVISNHAFHSAGSGGGWTLKIPNSVTTIKDYGLHNCSINDIVIPDSVTKLGTSVLGGCFSLEKVTLSKNITSIPSEAFINCEKLTDITIPNKVTSIGSKAFGCCSKLSSVVIPDSVTYIGEKAFYKCYSLSSIVIPDSVTSIGGESVFAECSNLKYIVLGDNLPSIGNSMFQNCTSLTSVVVPDKAAKITVSAFDGCTNLKAILIPKSVKLMSMYAFEGCSSLSDVYYTGTEGEWNSISISGGNSKLTRATLHCYTPGTLNFGTNTSSNEAWVSSYDVNFGTDVVIPSEVPAGFGSIEGQKVVRIGDGTPTGRVFRNHMDIKSVAIPNSITEWETYEFEGCVRLTDVLIGDKITSIPSGSFLSCDSLKNVRIGSSVTSIGEDAFRNCSSLTSIEIPDSVESIGKKAFYYCSKLTGVVIGDSVTSIGDEAFYSCRSLKNVVIPDSVTSIGSGAFWLSGLTSVVIPKSITDIGENGFRGCSNLRSVVFAGGFSNDNVKTIRSNTFSYCEALASVVIPRSVTTIAANAFTDCPCLTRVYYCGTKDQWNQITIGSNNSPLTAATVYYLSTVRPTAGNYWRYVDGVPTPWETSVGLKFVSYGNGTCHVAGIGTCTDKDIAIPSVSPEGEKVTSIYEGAFMSSSLSSVSIPDSVKSIGAYAFHSCTSLLSIDIGPGAESIGFWAFGGCANLTHIRMGSSVKSIGESAFDGCSRLSSIVIPDSVTSIGKNAFLNCSLSAVYYRGSETQWNKLKESIPVTGNDCLLNAVVVYDYEGW